MIYVEPGCGFNRIVGERATFESGGPVVFAVRLLGYTKGNRKHWTQAVG